MKNRRHFLDTIAPAAKRKVYTSRNFLSADVAKGSLLYVHPFKRYSEMDRELLFFLLRNNYNVSTFDLPGHGLSVKDEKERATIKRSFKEEFVGLVRIQTVELLVSDETKDKPVFLIAGSFGALIIIRLMQIFPILARRVAGIVCIATPLEIVQNVSFGLRRLVWLLDHIPREVYAFTPLGDIEIDISSMDEETAEHEGEWRKMLDDPLYFKGNRIKLKTAVAIQRAVRAAHRNKKAIRTPCLFIHGKNDRIAIPAAVENFFNGISTPPEEKRLIMLEKGHFLLDENVDELCTIILEWMNERVAVLSRAKIKTAPQTAGKTPWFKRGAHKGGEVVFS
ncbi:lysophospholipase [bacterium]|nr:lysophospholipase [bacterium]MCI0680234.1 lysophospholipase [bacterium]